ncbi:MFS transporter [Rhodobacter sp. HX-7-19]|uniref:MFS transporter n=1 Tax=Paragemmobacter kunshanensis TaxID=2583234 RepID=A0A6M1TT11_9RHOB|nr:MFS transporter [Rhodobacter kunshanensis]NGQ90136.1 MFS transporter [Rhodobacter kunshanensis]
MIAGIAALVAAYVLSQFYRAFLAVLAPVLGSEIGASPEDLAAASGVWFLVFAVMQIPVGSALDRVGPRLTAAVLLGLGGAGGAAVFAMAEGPGAVTLAMALIGVGCAPVLMAAYYIFARTYSAAVFGTLAGVVIGVGSMGNIASSLPLAAAVEAFGWRETLWGLAGVTLLVALALGLLVRDPPKVEGAGRGSLMDLLRMPALWPVLIMMAVCYVPAAGLRGLWVGPYYRDVFGADAAAIGVTTLVMGVAMVAGNFAYGPLDRLLGTRKWLIFGGNLGVLVCLIGLWAMPAAGGWWTLGLLAALGFFGASFPMVMAHGRAFVPPHLMGRGVTLLNLFGIGAVGLAQVATGRLHAVLQAGAGGAATLPYQGLFAFFALLLAGGMVVYLFSQDRTD